jgi:hypothetical protein
MNSSPLEAIAATIMKKIRQPDFELPDFPKQFLTGEATRSIQFIAGPLGLQNNKAEWIDAFEGIKNFSAYSCKSSLGKIPVEASVISFMQEEDCRTFLRRSGMNDLPAVDAWTILSDGKKSSAFLRESSLRVLCISAATSEETLARAVKELK